jgi:hypothetical protein
LTFGRTVLDRCASLDLQGARSVLTVFAIVAVLAFSGLALYAMRNKVRLKVSASLLKLASFSIEVESQDERQGREMPPAKEIER